MNVKYIIFSFLLTTVYLASAQQTSTTGAMGEPSIGVYGGINFQNINGKDAAGDKLTNSLVPRFHVGVRGEIPIAPDFYAQIGLQYISKGTKGEVEFNDNNGSQVINRELKLNYVEMPLHLVFKPVLGKGYLVLGFGPYLGYAISGKAIFSGNSAPADSDLQFMKDVPDGATNNLVYFKNADVGSDFFVGYEFKSGLNFIFNSQLGLIQINSNTNSKLSDKNTGFGLSAGFNF
jgi:hypothetical protein